MVWGTKLGYETRELIDKWDSALIREAKDRQIRMFLDGQNFVLFFEYGGDVYGTTESNRVTYSKMKDPDEDTTEEWVKEAHFMAFNLSKAVTGKPAQEIFYSDDIDEIDVMDKDQAFHRLKEMAEEVSLDNVSSGTKAILQAMKQMQSKMGSPDMPLNQGKKP